MRIALLASVVLSVCSPRVTPIGTVDGGAPPETLTLTGRVCTALPDQNSFEVKVVLLVDQSGSMCVTDPPGSQGSSSFCSMIPGPAEASRVTALRELVQQLEARPNTRVALVPFDTNVRTPWPMYWPQRFARPDSTLQARVTGLSAELGRGTDYQGALDFARTLIEQDVVAVNTTTPDLLPRTKYVVLLLSDGVPFPRCAANDSLSTYADDSHPDLTWADSPAAGTYCNTASPADPDGVTGFVAGTDRNQNYQLFGIVDQLRALKAQYHVGDIRLNTALVFNQQSVDACGPLCQDLFGPNQRWPGPVTVQLAQNVSYTTTATRWLLQQLATHGGGGYSEFLGPAGVPSTGLASLDWSSLAAPNRIKRLMVQPLRAVASGGAWAVDSDGDGLSDDLEAANQTNPLVVDTDADGFSDRFEVNARYAGFDPLMKDARGCDPASPLTPSCVIRDFDGDGLSQFAESWYGSATFMVDSDRDGLPDGVESRAGLSPVTRAMPLDDQDGDQLSDGDELLSGSDPHFADRAFSDQSGISITTTETLNADGTACYAFTASNLPMVATPGDAGTPAGLSLFKVWFGEAPEGLTDDYGRWRTACAWARRDDGVLVPPDLSLAVDSSYFVALPQVAPQVTQCAGSAATMP